MYNEIDIIEGVNGLEIKINGKLYINLFLNNYLGLVINEDLKLVVKVVIDIYGVGVGVVCIINGILDLYDELEEILVKFKGIEVVIVY